MNNITVSDGLSGMSVSNIIIDRNGQAWMSTSNGVSMFNGKSIYSYNIPQKNISQRYCFNIAFDESNHLYAATRGGLFVLKEGNFQRVSSYKDIVEDVLPVKNKIYFATRHGLFIYSEGVPLKRILVSHSQEINNSIRSIQQAKDGSIWFTSRYTLNHYIPSTNFLDRIMIKSLSGLNKLEICGKDIFIGTKNNGLLVYNTRSHRSELVSLPCNVITTLRNVSNKYLCVGTDGGGAFLIDVKTHKIISHYGVNEKGANHLPDNAVYCYYRDESGVDWFGFYRYGFCYRLHKEPLFKYYTFGNFTTQGLDVKSFFIDDKIKIIGVGNGMYYVDESKNEIRYFSPQEIGANAIMCISKYNGVYYIGSYDGGLVTLDPKTMKIKRPSDNIKFKYSTFANMTIGPDNRLWTTSSEGLFIFDKKGNISNINENNADIYGGTIVNVIFDDEGKGWMGTMDGICIYNATISNFRKDGFPAGFFNKNKSMYFLNAHGGLIIAFGGNNLYYTDAKMARFGKMTLPAGILEEKCNGIVDDGEGFYWIITEKGLFRVSYKMDIVQHFSNGEGLNSIILGKLKMDEHKNLWLAASDGLMIVNSHNLTRWKNNERYKVIPYHMSVDGYTNTPYEDNTIVDSKRMLINWNIISQEFKFIPILEDYAQPDGRFYEYSVDGVKWILTKDGEEVSLGRIFVGIHKLKIRLAGANGTESTYSVVVRPSFLFYVEIVFLVVAIWYLIWWRKFRKHTKALLEERDTMEQTLIEEEQERQKQQMEQENIDIVNADCNSDDKYRYVKLDMNEADEIISRMNDYMDKERPYLDQDMRISDLASVLNVSQTLLSMVFAMRMKETYYDYVNSYRLKEFKIMLSHGDYKNYKLTTLSEKCGFKKTSFFTTFRKIEGMTPTEYIQRMRK